MPGQSKWLHTQSPAASIYIYYKPERVDEVQQMLQDILSKLSNETQDEARTRKTCDNSSITNAHKPKKTSFIERIMGRSQNANLTKIIACKEKSSKDSIYFEYAPLDNGQALNKKDNNM